MFGLQCLVTHLFYCDFHNSVESRLPSACLKLRFGLISEHTCSLGRLTHPLERELEFTPVLQLYVTLVHSLNIAMMISF